MKSEENAYFIKRLGALILDMIIVSTVVSMLTFFVNNNSNYEKLTKLGTYAQLLAFINFLYAYPLRITCAIDFIN